MKKIVLLSLIILLTGCQPAIISSQIRESGEAGNNKMIRCVNFATGNEGKTNSLLQQYDGWKMVYVSEYTTSNKANSAVVMCFEKASSN